MTNNYIIIIKTKYIVVVCFKTLILNQNTINFSSNPKMINDFKYFMNHCPCLTAGAAWALFSAAARSAAQKLFFAVETTFAAV